MFVPQIFNNKSNKSEREIERECIFFFFFFICLFDTDTTDVFPIQLLICGQSNSNWFVIALPRSSKHMQLQCVAATEKYKKKRKGTHSSFNISHTQPRQGLHTNKKKKKIKKNYCTFG